MSISIASLTALIKLLDDDQDYVIQTARSKLIQMGEEVVPHLEKAVCSNKEPRVRSEARSLLDQIQLNRLTQAWFQNARLSDSELDLETSVFMLAQVVYPDLNASAYRDQLDYLANTIRPAMAAAQTPKAQLRAMNHVLFEFEGFEGNWGDYFDPDNSFLNQVLDRRLGSPIALATLYLLIGRRLGLSLEGLGIPGHFMVQYPDCRNTVYVDVFNGGRFLSRGACIQTMVEAGYPYQLSFLEPIRARDILSRTIRNLILIYMEQENEKLEKTFETFLEALTPGDVTKSSNRSQSRS